jgi:hypothetical protein
MQLGPTHLQQDHRSKVFKWIGQDSQESFDYHMSLSDSREKLEKFGWTDPDCISYSYNSQGFRDEEFNNDPAGLALGCSFTQGTGIDLDSTWHRQLSQMLDMRIWNLGLGGSATDTAYRLAEHWITHLNVKFVTMCVPDVHRFEIWDNGVPHAIMHNNTSLPILDDFKKVYWGNDQNGKINQAKNLLAIKQLCAQAGVPFYYLFLKTHWRYVDLGRDLVHSGKKSNKMFAEIMHKLIKGLPL